MQEAYNRIIDLVNCSAIEIKRINMNFRNILIIIKDRFENKPLFDVLFPSKMTTVIYFPINESIFYNFR